MITQASNARTGNEMKDETGKGRVRTWRTVYVLILFFFQAEDGIRDYKVTGVQTCALPILGRGGGEIQDRWLLAVSCLDESGRLRRPLEGVGHHDRDRLAVIPDDVVLQRRRSEERRVGKEGRSRWSPDH